MFDFAHLVLFEFFVVVEMLPPTQLLTLFLKKSANSISSQAGHLACVVDGDDIFEVSRLCCRSCSSKARHMIKPIDAGSVDHQVRMLRPVK